MLVDFDLGVSKVRIIGKDIVLIETEKSEPNYSWPNLFLVCLLLGLIVAVWAALSDHIRILVI